MTCPNCEGKGVIIDPELGTVTRKDGEPWSEFMKRVQSLARYCDCDLGQRIRFFHLKANQLSKKVKP